MRKMSLLAIGSLLIVACHQRAMKAVRNAMGDATAELVQEKQVGNIKVRLMYMPRYWHRMEHSNHAEKEDDSAEMDFRLSVEVPPGSGQMNMKALQYGIDTLFTLCLGTDTLKPVYAQQIPDGGIHGIKYLLGFERQPFVKDEQAVLIFNDHLFTNNRLRFPFKTAAFQKIDSLSAQL